MHFVDTDAVVRLLQDSLERPVSLARRLLEFVPLDRHGSWRGPFAQQVQFEM